MAYDTIKKVGDVGSKGANADYQNNSNSSETFIDLGECSEGLGTHQDFENSVSYYDLRFAFDKPVDPNAHERLLSSGTVSMTNVKVIMTNHVKVPQLYAKLWGGSPIEMITTKRTENTEGETRRVIEEMTFETNYITYMDYHGDKMELWFRPLKFTMKKTPVKQAGTPEGVIESTYDFETNTTA